jgi:hypothetical protein
MGHAAAVTVREGVFVSNAFRLPVDQLLKHKYNQAVRLVVVAGIEALAAWAQARPRTSGSRLAMHHVCANTAGLHASAAMGFSGRLEFDSSNHGLC